jgi:hypothetical protein
MPANDNAPMAEEHEAAQTALDGLRARGAAGWPIAPPAIDDAVRRSAMSDLDAQCLKRWEPTR